MNERELVKCARECTTIGGDCANCPFDRHIGADGAICSELLVRALVRALAERVEKLGEHCARHAEELAVQQERDRWISVEERLPERDEGVLVTVSGTYGQITFERALMLGTWLGPEGWYCAEWPLWETPGVTHWRPLPALPEEVEHGTADI